MLGLGHGHAAMPDRRQPALRVGPAQLQALPVSRQFEGARRLEAMIIVESQIADHRRARVFFRELPPDAQTADALATARYWDDEDQDREPVLQHILARPMSAPSHTRRKDTAMSFRSSSRTTIAMPSCSRVCW